MTVVPIAKLFIAFSCRKMVDLVYAAMTYAVSRPN